MNIKNVDVNLLKKVNKTRFEQRESGVTHTPYQIEKMLYICIKEGDIIKLEKALSTSLDIIFVGNLSNDNIRQMQYLAVSCITLAIRYSIEGGLDEFEAYNLSDKYIRTIDSLYSAEKIFFLIHHAIKELTLKVKNSKPLLYYSPAVKKCIHYINMNLNNNITIDILAKECNLSKSYLCSHFKKITGRTINNYIISNKLEASKKLLIETKSISMTSYSLGFCSESYYISLFKRHYKVTPKQFINAST